MPMQRRCLGLDKLFNWVKTNTTVKSNLYILGIECVLCFFMFIGDLVKPLLTCTVLIWICIYWYVYRCNDKLTLKQFLFGYQERNDLYGSDAFFFKLLSSEFFKIIKSYPITMVYILFWYLPLGTLQKFWGAIKSIIEILNLFDILGFLNTFENGIEYLANILVPCMLVYKDVTQIVVNIVYLIVLWIVTYFICLRIKLSKMEVND